MNIKRKHLILFAVVGMIALAGCAGAGVDEAEKSQEQAEDLAGDTNADTDSAALGASYEYEVRITESNQQNLVRGQPPQVMESSLERQNLLNRYEYLNDENNVHHVYAMSNDGKVIAYWVAQGKVSSVNSKLTNDKQIIQIPQTKDWGSTYSEYFRTVESPQMDGSYGSNGDAIFFFTTSGDYVEFNGRYIVSEEPMNINTAVSLTQEVKENNG